MGPTHKHSKYPKSVGLTWLSRVLGGDPNSKPVQKLVPEGGSLTQQVNEYSDVRAKRMPSGGKETKDNGYATRGLREKLDQVTMKPTVTVRYT